MITIPAEYAIPHSPGHELDVVATLLNCPYFFEEYPHLTPEHFHGAKAKAIFTMAQQARSKRQTEVFDFTSFMEEANKRGLLPSMGGQSGLQEVVMRGEYPAFMPTHIQTLNTYLARRIAIEAGMELVRSAFEEEIGETLEKAGQPITAIHEAVAAVRPALSTKSIIVESFEAYRERLEGRESPMGIPTIPEIDHLIRGIHLRRVYIIAAPTGGGKSVLSSQIITLQSLEGVPVLEINYEMKERDSMDRKLIQMSRVPSQAFMDPLAYAKENSVPPINTAFMQSLTRVRDALAKAPIFIRKPHNRSLLTLSAMIRKEVRTNGVKVVAIDYLQKIRCKAASREAEIEEISGTLFDLADELDIAILLLSQVNVNGDTKHGIVAAEDCDGFLLVNRETNKDAENFGQYYDIQLVKDRHCGHSGASIPLIFDKSQVRFVHGFNPKPKKAAAKGPQKRA